MPGVERRPIAGAGLSLSSATLRSPGHTAKQLSSSGLGSRGWRSTLYRLPPAAAGSEGLPPFAHLPLKQSLALSLSLSHAHTHTHLPSRRAHTHTHRTPTPPTFALHRVPPFSETFKALLSLSSDNLSSLPYPPFVPRSPLLPIHGNSHPRSPLCSLGLKTDQNEQILLILRLNIKVTLPVESFLACPGP